MPVLRESRQGVMRVVALTLIFAAAAQGVRTVNSSERGLLMLTPYDNNWSSPNLGAYVGSVQTSYDTFAPLDNETLKISHGRFHMFKPSDDTSWVWFPYQRFKNYEADELANGRGPLWATGTYLGQSRPLYWGWSLGSPGEGSVPSRLSSSWEQLVRISDDRFIKFWIHEYVFNLKRQRTTCFLNTWDGGDECAQIYGLYGVVDGSGCWRTSGLTWDAPFPQSSPAFLNDWGTMFSRIKAFAPDIQTMANLGSMDSFAQYYTTVYANCDGIMCETLNDMTYGDSSRGGMKDNFDLLKWFGEQGKVAILRATVDHNNFSTSLRTAYVCYLIARGDNSFFGPSDSGNVYSELNPATTWEPMRNKLGFPTGAWTFTPQYPGNNSLRGWGLYSRPCQGGIVYLNMRTTDQTITLPTGTTWYDRNGNGVTTLVVPQGTGDYVTYSPAAFAAIPTIRPIRPGTVKGPLAVTLDTTTAGGTIYYTTNGSTPDNTSTRYSGSFTLSSSCTLKAVTVAPGMANSFPATAAYTLTSTVPSVDFYFASDNNSEFVKYDYPLVHLNYASKDTVTVRYSVSGGTAVNGVDFNCSSGALTFNPGETYKRFKIEIIDNAYVTPNKTIVVSLSNPSNATLGSQTTYTYTIVDNDNISQPAPTDLINEHFDANPGWTASPAAFTGTNNFGYNSVRHAIAQPGSTDASGVFQRSNVTNRYFADLHQTLDGSRDFFFSFTWKAEYLSGVGAMGIVGLLESGGMNDQHGVYVFHYGQTSPSSHVEAHLAFREYKPDNTSQIVDWAGPAFDIPLNVPYVEEVFYSAATRTFSFLVYPQSAVRDPSKIKTRALDPGYTTLRAHLFGVGNVDTDSYATSYTLKATADDMLVQVMDNVTGALVLGGYVGDISQMTGQIEFRQNGAAVRTAELAPDVAGRFEIPSVAPGAYDLTITMPHCLQTTLDNVTVNVNPTDLGTITLVNGDINGDNQVSFEDFAILQNNYGQTGKTGSQGDLNGDGAVTFADFAILQNAYGQSGAGGTPGAGTAAAAEAVAGPPCGLPFLAIVALLTGCALFARDPDRYDL